MIGAMNKKEIKDILMNMMDMNIFQGELVCLTAEDPQTIGKAYSHWCRNSEYCRLLDTEHSTMNSIKKIKEYFEKNFAKEDLNEFSFLIRTLDNKRLIGFVGLIAINWSQGDCWVGIGLGEPRYWGKGYGTDAMRIALHYAFYELNLHRVSLGVLSYNARAIRSYEKAGFKMEGTERLLLHRDGSRADVFYMGILRDEWEANHSRQLVETTKGT